MTDEEQERTGFESVSKELSRIAPGSLIGAYHKAHEIWHNLACTGVSSYSDGCRKACRMYFRKSCPDQKILREIRAERREAHGM